ncbi:MAG: hypothetical protein CVV22_02370 [Ignavibacteriae bacterium HGW-Ignavibacteriae-1]|jgi:protein involved in polysaccharide export with SLBB domain|nr:MAG: hypothetical protein CVV22_02370 [Ignavibacteriae bacterium HGW-Ignavibacteriae-1]
MYRNIAVCIFVFLMVIANHSNLQAQIKGLSGMSGDELLKMELESQFSDDAMRSETMPVGNIIDPELYFLGPEDVLTIQIVPIMSNPRSIKLSPDMSIMIPRVGKIDMRGLTLKQAQDSIEAFFKAYNPKFEVSTNLRAARQCIVKIAGNVLYPSIYTMPSSYQVSTAILFANQLQKNTAIALPQMEALLQVQEAERETERRFSESGLSTKPFYSSRNIILLRKDGSSLTIDLEKAAATNDAAYDPYVKEGDEIIVPFDRDNFPMISISGGVTRPIILPYKPGDKASLLLKFGYGLTDDADINNIKIYMPSQNKQILLKTDKSLNLIGEDFEIEPGAVIIVGQSITPQSQSTGTVSIKGQVRNPGNYLITLRNTRLRDLIDMAGGFTQDAYLPLANIVRRESKLKSLTDPRQETYEVMQYSDLTMDDTTRYYIDMKYKQPLVATDFVELFEKNNDINDVLLYDGDIIHIPTNPGLVFVNGQVKNPGYVEFEEGRNMSWYIERAGGFAEGSEPERARIIRGRTNVWIAGADDVVVYAGDQIYAPRVPDEPTTLKLQRFAVYASLIATVSILITTVFTLLTRK